MHSSAQLKAVPSAPPRATRALRQPYARNVVEALAALFPAGRHDAVDLRGRPCHLDVFITREWRGKKEVTCGLRIVYGRFEFALDDGADEFARTQLIGPPTLDGSGNVGVSALVRTLDGSPRSASLWLAHDLSVIAIEDEILYLR